MHDTITIYEGNSPEVLARLGELATKISALQEGQAMQNTTLQAVSDDLTAIKAQQGDYIAGRDKIDDDYKTQIADLQAKLAADEITIADFNAQATAVLAQADEAKAQLVLPGTAPAGDGTGTTTPPAGDGSGGTTTPPPGGSPI